MTWIQVVRQKRLRRKKSFRALLGKSFVLRTLFIEIFLSTTLLFLNNAQQAPPHSTLLSFLLRISHSSTAAL